MSELTRDPHICRLFYFFPVGTTRPEVEFPGTFITFNSKVLSLINLSEFGGGGGNEALHLQMKNALVPLTLLLCLRNGRSPDPVIHGPLAPQQKGLLTQHLLVPVTLHQRSDQEHYLFLHSLED